MLKPWILAAVGLSVHDVVPRASSDCGGGTYTSLDGLNFDITCNAGVMTSDVVVLNNPNKTKSSIQDSLTACMEACSISRQLCYGVSFNSTDGNCTYKTEDYVPSKSSSEVHSAIAPSYQFQLNDTTCPYEDDATNDIDGAEWLVTCFTDMLGDDYADDDGDWFHTDTFEECIKSCISFHPLCKSVSWEGNMYSGYANCYRKYGNTTDNRSLSPTGSSSTHTAQILLPNLNFTCDNGNIAVAGRTFNVDCQKSSGGTVMEERHALDLASCMEACSNQSSCSGVNWGAVYDDGYQNCQLLSDTGSIYQNQTYHTAVVINGEVSTGDQGSASTSSRTSTSITASASTIGGAGGDTNESGGSNGSLAWIAGVIIAVLFITAAAFALFLFCRRKARKREQGTRQMTIHPDNQFSDRLSLPNSHTELQGNNTHNMQQTALYMNGKLTLVTRPAELPTDGNGPVELAG